MDVDRWLSLPLDLFLEIFRRLEATAALRCTGVCKPWRRAIIGNAASCLRPRPDCFVPGLLLGFFNNYRDSGGRHVRMQRLPGPSEPAPAGLAPYDEVLSSRDGLVLLGGRAARDLCLCSLMTGDHKFLPAGAFKACTYVLLTGYDLAVSDGGGGDNLRALILAVKEKNIEGGLTYQILSTSDGAWGAVTRSPRFRFRDGLVTRIHPGSEAVCRGTTVHWLGTGTAAGVVECTVALDVRTRRTWLTGLPDGCGLLDCYSSLRTSPVRLATSGDGRLSVVRSCGGCLVEVWVLAGGDQWSLRRTINVLPCCRGDVWFSAFCPRSGRLLGNVDGKDLVVDAGKGSCCLLTGCVDTRGGTQ